MNKIYIQSLSNIIYICINSHVLYSINPIIPKLVNWLSWSFWRLRHTHINFCFLLDRTSWRGFRHRKFEGLLSWDDCCRISPLHDKSTKYIYIQIDLYLLKKIFAFIITLYYYRWPNETKDLGARRLTLIYLCIINEL